jgi:putative ABC transport system permease protein
MKNIFILAWRNLWRNPRRTILTMASVTFAVMLAVLISSLQRGAFDHLVKNVAGSYTGYLQVHHAGYWDEPTLDNLFAETDSIHANINSVKGVVAVTGRLESFCLAAKDEFSRVCLVTGIDPDRENDITKIYSKITEGSPLAKNDKAVIMGSGLAADLSLRLGDTVILVGQGYHGSSAAGKFPIKGIIHFGAPELNDKVIYMPLAEMQYFLDAREQLSSYVISINKPSASNEIRDKLRSRLSSLWEVMSWEEMLPEIKNHIDADTGSFVLISGILYFVISFGIFGTLIMMMTERKYELGMLLALGMTKRKMGFMLMLETFALIVSGVLLGIVFSFPLVLWFRENPIRLGGNLKNVYERFGFEAIIPTILDRSVFIEQSIIVLILALMLGFYPLLKTFRMNAVESMKR